MTIQTSAAVAAAIWVTSIAMPASPPAVSAQPALKPNQPTHSMPAPTMVSHGLRRLQRRREIPRGPSTTRTTSAETPAVVWTTMPPAKSRRPLGEPAAAPHPMRTGT